jgi:hypothetical protein
VRVRRLEQFIVRMEVEGERRDRMEEYESLAQLPTIDELSHEQRLEVIDLSREINDLVSDPRRAAEVVAMGERLRGIFWRASLTLGRRDDPAETWRRPYPPS